MHARHALPWAQVIADCGEHGVRGFDTPRPSPDTVCCVPRVTLRPFRADDLPVLDGAPQHEDGVDFFAFRSTNAFTRRYADDGLLSPDHGNLVVALDDAPIGDVGWYAVHNGPPSVARALNIGIELLPLHRGHGYGTTAQRLIAGHLFRTTTIERLEASTDADNLAEQHALTKAGFTREGRLRHAWFRAGAWRDTILYSRLRDDPDPDDR